MNPEEEAILLAGLSVIDSDIDALLERLNDDPEIDELISNLSAQSDEIDRLLADCAKYNETDTDLDALE